MKDRSAKPEGKKELGKKKKMHEKEPVPSDSIPVIEEKLKVGREEVETGKVRISKRVHEEEETIGVPESREKVHIERVPINQYVETAPPGTRQEGDTTIISVLKEVAVVEKRLLLVEEVHISRHKEKSISEQKVKLRKEEVHVDRQKGGTADTKEG